MDKLLVAYSTRANPPKGACPNRLQERQPDVPSDEPQFGAAMKMAMIVPPLNDFHGLQDCLQSFGFRVIVSEFL